MKDRRNLRGEVIWRLVWATGISGSLLRRCDSRRMKQDMCDRGKRSDFKLPPAAQRDGKIQGRPLSCLGDWTSLALSTSLPLVLGTSEF